MTEVDDKFFAWLDGELGGHESDAMAARVAADPHLTSLAEQHRAMQERLRGAFDTVAMAPGPARLSDSLRPQQAAVIDLGGAKRAREARRWQPLPQWAAMAATLVIGVFLGSMVQWQGNAPVELRGGQIFAAAALDHALDSELASAPRGNTRIGLTFHDSAGAICRSFTETHSSGLACRRDGRWELRGLFAAPEGQGSAYRMAGGMDPNLAALVDSTMAGEPFDAAQEKAAKGNGWR